MKLRDFLKVADKNQFIVLDVSVYGMRFETKHSADFYLSSGAELNDKEIEVIYTREDELHIKLRD